MAPNMQIGTNQQSAALDPDLSIMTARRGPMHSKSNHPDVDLPVCGTNSGF